MRLSWLELGNFTLESDALPACPFPVGTLISCRTVYLNLYVHRACALHPFYSALNSITTQLFNLIFLIYFEIYYTHIKEYTRRRIKRIKRNFSIRVFLKSKFCKNKDVCIRVDNKLQVLISGIFTKIFLYNSTYSTSYYL